jgi:hypothetical protein
VDQPGGGARTAGVAVGQDGGQDVEVDAEGAAWVAALCVARLDDARRAWFDGGGE